MIIMWREWSIQCLWSLISRQSARPFPHITLDDVLNGPYPSLYSIANYKSSGFPPIFLDQISVGSNFRYVHTSKPFIENVGSFWWAVFIWDSTCSVLWPSQVTNGPSYSTYDLQWPLALWLAAACSALGELSSHRPPEYKHIKNKLHLSLCDSFIFLQCFLKCVLFS